MIDRRTIWLASLGYRMAFRTEVWVECLLWRDAERWIGIGADEEEAFEQALRAALPSAAARVAFEIAIGDRGSAASTVDEDTAAPHATGGGSSPVATLEPRPEQVMSQEVTAQEVTAQEVTAASSSSDEPGPTPQASPITAAPEVLAHATERIEESPRADGEVPELGADPVQEPTRARGGVANLTRPAPESTPEPARTLSLDEAHAELDALLSAIDANHQEASLLAPVRQRLLIISWMARARAIQDAMPYTAAIEKRVYGIAQDLGKLAKVWWPGMVRVLAKKNSPRQARIDFDADLGETIHTWQDVEAAAVACLDRIEVADAADGMDEFGWSDAPQLQPPPRHPQELLDEIKEAIEARLSPALLRPREAIHTSHLAPELGPSGATGVDWPELAARLRWLRGTSVDVEIWGAAIGRLRWLADAHPEVSNTLRRVLDPSFRPSRDWMHHLGVERREREVQRDALLHRRPTSACGSGELVDWLGAAFDLGDVLSNEQIAGSLSAVADHIATLPDASLPERRHRRRLKALKEHLGPCGASAVAPGPVVAAAQPRITRDGTAETTAASLEERLAASLRDRTTAKRILFVSNRHDAGRDQRLMDLLGIATVDPCLSEPARVEAKGQGIRMGTYDFVLAATGFLPHKVDAALKSACRVSGTPYVRVNRGRPLQCLMHLARELGIGQQKEAAT